MARLAEDIGGPKEKKIPTKTTVDQLAAKRAQEDKVDFVAEVGNVPGQPPDTGLPDFSPTRGTPQAQNPHEPQAHPPAKSRHRLSLLWILKDSTPLQASLSYGRAGSFSAAVFRGKSDG